MDSGAKHRSAEPSRAREVKKLGRPKVSKKVEAAIREHLAAGHGILKVAAMAGVGSGTVQRVKREMIGQMKEAA